MTNNNSSNKYVIPETTRTKWKQLAASAGLPYATIVGQHIYDLEGLEKTLSEQLAQATALQNGPSINQTPVSSATPPGTTQGSSEPKAGTTQAANTNPANSHHLTQLQAQLTQTQAQLAAYRLEQAQSQ